MNRPATHCMWAVVWISCLTLLLSCAARTPAPVAADNGPPETATSKPNSSGFPDIRLPAPEASAARDYLGIADQTEFSIADIRTRILIIEVFSMY